ncbi:hypothetical protein [Paractinoplanes atraurantiacus]|uniref:Uncharacterized protein n=1 Tax=Paractinoplanes atraurantiacus TaxID=1036182 RepID=A0A285J2H2_9ACTN|nr:hypothetical protein [Actinoplanes atraurantiacus]SNY54464.1 hypothetical protein SAMN05421748_11579 [Actinoplanes atraurantiacus]
MTAAFAQHSSADLRKFAPPAATAPNGLGGLCLFPVVARAYVQDRQHQSYAVIAGLGPLAGAYKAGSLAVTGITTTPPTTVSDSSPADSALGAGSPTSALGQSAAPTPRATRRRPPINFLVRGG